jgi:transposase
MDTTTPPFASIGIDIGKEVFHIVGFGTDGKIAFRRKIKRLALAETFKKLPPCVVGMETCLSAHFVSRALRQLGHEPRIIPAIYVKPFVKGQKNDYNDAEAIAEASLRPNLRTVREKTQDELDLQACHRVRSRLVSRRTATINQIRAFLIEQGIAVRAGARALRNSLLAILKNRQDEISPRMNDLIAGLYDDWISLDERIDTIASEIEKISEKEANCRRLMSVPGIGPLISTAVVAAIGAGEVRARARFRGMAWSRATPVQHRWPIYPRRFAPKPDLSPNRSTAHEPHSCDAS